MMIPPSPPTVSAQPPRGHWQSPRPRPGRIPRRVTAREPRHARRIRLGIKSGRTSRSRGPTSVSARLDGYRISLSGASSTEVEHAPGVPAAGLYDEAGEVHPGRLDDRLDPHLANVACSVIGVGHDPVGATDDEAGDPSNTETACGPSRGHRCRARRRSSGTRLRRAGQADEPGRHCDVRLDTPDRASNPHRVDEEEHIQHRPPAAARSRPDHPNAFDAPNAVSNVAPEARPLRGRPDPGQDNEHAARRRVRRWRWRPCTQGNLRDRAGIQLRILPMPARMGPERLRARQVSAQRRPRADTIDPRHGAHEWLKALLAPEN